MPACISASPCAARRRHESLLAPGRAWAWVAPSAGARAMWQYAAAGSRALQTCRWLELACSRLLLVTCMHGAMLDQGCWGVWLGV